MDHCNLDKHYCIYKIETSKAYAEPAQNSSEREKMHLISSNRHWQFFYFVVNVNLLTGTCISSRHSQNIVKAAILNQYCFSTNVISSNFFQKKSAYFMQTQVISLC